MDGLLIHQVDEAISAESGEVQSEMSMITHVQSTNEWTEFGHHG